MKNSYMQYTLLFTVICLLTSCSFAKANAEKTIVETTKAHGDKYEFCGDNDSYISNGRRQIKKRDLREFTVPAGGVLEVDGRQNGGISVVGENRSDVLIKACVRSWANSEAEAITSLNNTRIETSGVIRGENADVDAKFSISYKILVPEQQDLKLNAKNGGISIKSVDGNLRFETINGGLSLKNISGDVKGSTTNGGVSVRLAGNSFSGNGLDVRTTNGGVKLILPKNFAADVETGTVNGGFRSEFSELQYKADSKNRWSRPKRVKASLNGGGTKIRVMTTNGGVKIATAE